MISDEEFLIRLGKRIRELRISRNWTLEEAEEYGWPSWRHLQQIETGKKKVSIITIRQIAKLYKITISNLLRDL